MEATGTAEVLGGRYRLDESLGRGGMGEVWRAHDLLLDREVAVKLLRNDEPAEPHSYQRFEDEARAAARVCHPNAVAVYDIGHVEGSPYIVMEHMPGRTLADEMRGGPLGPSRVRQIGRDVAAGLTPAHNLGVVHLDVKPANILLAADGTAKITDFGIARRLDTLGRSCSGEIVGTASYLAPERLSGQGGTPASDVYALGVVLYEALSGQKPSIAADPLSLAGSVASGDRRPLAELRPDAPPDLVVAIERALEPEPQARWSSAAEMAGALSGGPTDEPTAPLALAVADDFGAPATPTAETSAFPAPIVPSSGDTARLYPALRHARRRPAAPALAAILVVLALTLGPTGAGPGDSADDLSPGEAAEASASQPVEPEPLSGLSDPAEVPAEHHPDDGGQVGSRGAGAGGGRDEGQGGETDDSRDEEKGDTKDKQKGDKAKKTDRD